MKQIRGTFVLIGLTPDGFRLGLHTGDGVEAGNRAIEHAEAALDFGGEVDVARRIDDVDADVLPGAGGRGGGDGDAALLLLLHPVHGRRTLMHFSDTVRDARIEEDAFGRRRLSGVDVRHDPDIPATIQRYSACHSLDLLSAGSGPAVLNPKMRKLNRS